MKDKPISVLIADDHSVVRIGMSALLGAEGDIHVVGQAKNGMEAVAQAIEKLPDVIIMDIEMPKKDGIEATTDILAEIPDARILILTSFSTTDRIARAIKAGALGAIIRTPTTRRWSPQSGTWHRAKATSQGTSDGSSRRTRPPPNSRRASGRYSIPSRAGSPTPTSPSSSRRIMLHHGQISIYTFGRIETIMA